MACGADLTAGGGWLLLLASHCACPRSSSRTPQHTEPWWGWRGNCTKHPLRAAHCTETQGFLRAHWTLRADSSRCCSTALYWIFQNNSLFLFVWFYFLSEHLAFCSSKSCCGKVCRGEILEPMGSRWWDQQLSHLRPSVEGMTLWQCIGTCLAKTKSCVIVADWKRRSGLDGVPKPGIRTARLGS